MDTPLTTADLAKLLNIPVGTLRYWRHLSPPEGPRCYQLGRKRIVYDIADVQAWRTARKDATAKGGVA